MTECIALSPLTEDDLLAALDGEADERVLTHLQACAFCSARLGHMRKFEQGVHMLMYRSDCPSTDELADYVMGEIAPDSHKLTEQHLKKCVHCREEIQQLQMLLQVDDVLVEQAAPTEPLWKQVKGWLEDLEDQIVNVLVPQPLTAYASLKGAGDRERILNYEHEYVTVMLRLEKVMDGLKVNGTIIDSENAGLWAGGHAELTAEGRFLAVIDDDENFTFEHLTSGLFQLNIYSVSNRILRLNDIDLTL